MPGTKDVQFAIHAGVLKPVNSRNQKTNPVSLWKLADHHISPIAFSPGPEALGCCLERWYFIYALQSHALPIELVQPLSPAERNTYAYFVVSQD